MAKKPRKQSLKGKGLVKKNRSKKRRFFTRFKDYILHHKIFASVSGIALILLAGIVTALIWKHNLDVEHEQYLAYRESLTRFQTYFDRCDTYDDNQKFISIDKDNPHKMKMTLAGLRDISNRYDSFDDAGGGHHRYKCLIRELGLLDNSKFVEDLAFQSKTDNVFSNKVVWQTTYEGKDNILINIQTVIPAATDGFDSLMRQFVGFYTQKDVVFTLHDKETENKE